MSDTRLVTGSSGFIGSEIVEYFTRNGWRVHRVDNNQRADFFGPAGDTRWNQKRLLSAIPPLPTMNWISATAIAWQGR